MNLPKLHQEYKEAQKCVSLARNNLYEAYNKLFETFATLHSASAHYISVSEALESIDEQVATLLSDASMDKVNLGNRVLHKYFSVGRVVYVVTYDIVAEDVGEYVFYTGVRVSCDVATD